jgi:RNA polymerase sigma-70 factor, ECF subfamily
MRQFSYSGRHTFMPLDELLRACAEGSNEEAWQEFVAHFGSLIGAVVLKTARRWGDSSPDIVNDLIQDTYLKLYSNRTQAMVEFEARHDNAFYGYIKVVAANVVNDSFRARHSQKRNSDLEHPLEDIALEIADGNFGSAEQIERSALLSEIEELLNKITKGPNADRDRTIFWLYWRQGMTAQSISELPAIALTAKGVETAVYRLTRQIRESLAEQRCGLDAAAKGQAS